MFAFILYVILLLPIYWSRELILELFNSFWAIIH